METSKNKKGTASIKEMANLYRSLTKADRNNLFHIGYGMKIANTVNGSKGN